MVENWFVMWKDLAMSMFTFGFLAIALFGVCGCCLIPCVRGLLQKWINAALSKQILVYQLISQTVDEDVESCDIAGNPHLFPLGNEEDIRALFKQNETTGLEGNDDSYVENRKK